MTDFFVLVHSPTLPFDGSMMPIAALGPYEQDAAERLAVRMGAFENRTAEVVTVVPVTVEVIAFPVSLHDSENLTSALFSHLIKGSETASDPASDPAAERVRESGKIEKVNPSAETLVREAAEVEEKSVYDFTDLLDVVTAEAVTLNFSRWVVKRFYEEAEAGFEFEVVRGGRQGQKAVTVEQSPWVTWSMVGLTTMHGMQGLNGVGAKDAGPHVQMSKYTADDRGPGSRGPVVAFPLDVLFSERKRNEEYAEYLRLKAIFEPGESDGQS